jgi:hypothetical protein
LNFDVVDTIESRRTAVRQAKIRPEHASVYVTRNISTHFYLYHNSVNFPRIVMSKKNNEIRHYQEVEEEEEEEEDEQIMIFMI